MDDDALHPHAPDAAADPRAFHNIIVMSIGIFFVFGGFYPAQSFASSLLNFTCVPLGDISIGVVRWRHCH